MKVPQINSFSVFKTDFSSTKELYSYAQKKIINCAKKENKEYLIIANTKTNKILFEKMGDENSVDIREFSFPDNEKNNITLIHGHVTKFGSPLSTADCLHLCNEKYEKIIAINKKGRFSLLQRKADSNTEEAKRFFKYGIYFQEPSFLPKNPIKKWFVTTFVNNEKLYEKWIKRVVEKRNMNFRYFSTMFK